MNGNQERGTARETGTQEHAIVIEVRGGLVEAVYASDENAVVEIIDYDVCDADLTTEEDSDEELEELLERKDVIMGHVRNGKIYRVW